MEEERAKTNRLAELLESAKRRLTTVEEDVAHADARYLQRSNSEEEYIQVKRQHQRPTSFFNSERVILNPGLLTPGPDTRKLVFDIAVIFRPVAHGRRMIKLMEQSQGPLIIKMVLT